MRFNSTARRIYLAPVLGLAFAAAISACSSGSSSSSSTPGSSASDVTSTATASPAAGSPSPASTATSAATGSAAAIAQITANWNEFFNPKTPNSKRVQLLQNGSDFSAALSAFEKSPLATAVTSKVDSVALTSATEATVKYDLSALGTTVASGASGTSVLQDGVWKVGDTVFCGLITEANSAGVTIPVPSACS